MDTMPYAASEPQLETSISEAISSVPPPKGVRLRDFALDMDHTGDPAIHVVFAVSRSMQLTKPYVREMNAFARAVSEALDRLQTGRLPYVILK